MSTGCRQPVDKTKGNRPDYQSSAIAFYPSTPIKRINDFMQTVAQKQPLTYVDGQLDALQRLAPLTTELDSDYFRGYRDTVIKYGVTPF